MSEPKVTVRRLEEYTQDQRNANKGTARGRSALEASLRENGAGRSLLADKHGNLIAGNKTAEEAAALGIDRVIEVVTDGTALVVVRREDVDLDSPEGRRLALADNRVGQLDLDWDAATLALLADETPGLLEGLFNEDELSGLLVAAGSEMLEGVEFKEYDESVANEVEFHECPNCKHRWPK